jgi:iron-sulfur cluster assembly protein
VITVTPAAAEQIKLSAKQSNAEGLPLRLAASRNPDGSIHYGMGFADQENDQDLSYKTEGVTIVVAPTSFELLDKMELDFVELENGEKNFIFKNPNDPNYKPA